MDFIVGVLTGILIGVIVGLGISYAIHTLLETADDYRCTGNCNQGRKCDCK